MATIKKEDLSKRRNLDKWAHRTMERNSAIRSDISSTDKT